VESMGGTWFPPFPKSSHRNEETGSLTANGVGTCRQAWRGADGCCALDRVGRLWSRIESLLPRVERRFRYPGRKRLPDRQALQGILFVLHTGIAWRHLPIALGFGGGSTCYRRLDEGQRAGGWERLRPQLPDGVGAAG